MLRRRILSMFTGTALPTRAAVQPRQSQEARRTLIRVSVTVAGSAAHAVMSMCASHALTVSPLSGGSEC